MKTPFRLQASEYDCVPTTFINALCKLYEREEIPPVVIQRIYLYCLDSISSRREFAHGTTDFAIKLLGNWLSEYRHKTFSVKTETIEAEQVHLSSNNKISHCLNDRGVALVNVTHYGGCWHYILALYVTERWLYAFDPYPKTLRANKIGCYEFLEPKSLHDPNLRINYDWLDAYTNRLPFRFGLKGERSCLLLSR